MFLRLVFPLGAPLPDSCYYFRNDPTLISLFALTARLSAF